MSKEHWIIIALYGTGILLLMIAFYEDTSPNRRWVLYGLAVFWPFVTLGLLARVIVEEALRRLNP